MATDHRRVDVELAQEVLLDDPDFLRKIVERVLQELLEAEMTEHVGAAPCERTDARKGHRNCSQAENAEDEGGYPHNLLVPQRIVKGPSQHGCSRVTSAMRRRLF